MIETLKERFILIKGNNDEFIIDFVQRLDDYHVGADLNEANFDLDRWFRNGVALQLSNFLGILMVCIRKKKN